MANPPSSKAAVREGYSSSIVSTFSFFGKKESKAAGKQSRHKGSKMRRKCVGNKVAGMFSCGQRDLCHLSEAQPQAGNKVRRKIWDKEKEQHKQEMGQRGRNNA